MIYDQNATTFDSSELNYNEMEARYLRQLNAMTEMNDKNLIAKGRHNLTLNRTEYYQRKREEALELYQGDNYEQNVKSLAKLAILPEMQEEIRQTLDRKKLLRDYERGILEGSVEYQRVSEAFDFFWVLTKYSLLRIPSTGEIAIFVYSYDVTNRVINSQIVAKLSSLEYDGIGLLNIKTHQYQLKGILTKLEGPRIVGEGDYDERVRERLSVNILPEEREEALKNFSVDHIVKQLENKEVYFFAYSIKDDEGNIRRKKMQFLYLDKVKFMVLYCRSDITSLYRKEQEQLRQTERALLAEQEAKKAKTFFLSRMSHDIRTPLNTIINLARMITEELDDKEAARADLKKMETANQFLLSLVNDILDMSKIEQRNIKLNSEIYSYSEFLNYIDSTFRPLCREKNISLSIEKGNADVAILIDKVRFNQMCFNLLSNAVKYTPAGGHVKMKMVHGAISQGKLPCDIYISDDGIGIKPEFLPHIYEPFSQEGRAFQSIEGTGLGLSIVKEIVDLLQGTIDVETEVGKGTTFHIHLDMTLAAPSKLTDQAEMYDMKLLSGKTVLLAEDHPMNQEITKRLLDKVEMNVVIADNGQKAVTEFENNSHRYDAILMDMRMPVMDGLQAARAIRALTIQKAKEIPIIAMTANAFEEDRKDSAAAGMNAHLAKPVDPDTLYHVLSQCIKDSLDHTL